MYWGKSNDNVLRKGQQNKDNIQRVMTVNLMNTKIRFPLNSIDHYSNHKYT